MELNPSQLNKIIHNVLSYSFDAAGNLQFHRFSPQQRQTYARESVDWTVKTPTGASVTFDFITNSDYIALEFTLKLGSSQRICAFDLYVDGVFFDQHYTEDLRLRQVRFALPEGTHRVTLYFPWSVQTAVSRVQLSDGASILPVEKKLKMLCFGDSITQGYTARCSSLSYVNQIARALDAEVVNQGIGGYYFNEETIDSSIVSWKPDIITVAYGTNDYILRETAQAYAQYAGAYIQKLAALFPQAKILGILPIYRNDQSYQDKRQQAGYDLEDARRILRECYLACPNGHVLEQTGIPHIPQAYVADYLHPNDLGFCIMSQGIVKKLRQLGLPGDTQ